MAAESMGIGIVPRMCVQEEETSGELVMKQIEEFEEQRGLWVVCRTRVRCHALAWRL